MDWTYGGLEDTDNPNLFKAEGGAAGVGIDISWNSTSGQKTIKPNTTENWGKRADGAIYGHKVRYTQTKSEIVGGPAGTSIVVLINYV